MLHELQGHRCVGEFHPSVTANALALILAKLEKHATFQHKMYDALEIEGRFESFIPL